MTSNSWFSKRTHENTFIGHWSADCLKARSFPIVVIDTVVAPLTNTCQQAPWAQDNTGQLEDGVGDTYTQDSSATYCSNDEDIVQFHCYRHNEPVSGHFRAFGRVWDLDAAYSPIVVNDSKHFTTSQHYAERGAIPVACARIVAYLKIISGRIDKTLPFLCSLYILEFCVASELASGLDRANNWFWWSKKRRWQNS